MDKILEGMLVSDKPDGLKRQVCRKVEDLGRTAQADQAVSEMFATTTRLILTSDRTDIIDACKSVYIVWAKNNRAGLEKYFNQDLLTDLLDHKVSNQREALWLIHESLIRLKSNDPNYVKLCKVMQIKAIDYVRRYPSFETISGFCRFLFDFRDCIPKGKYKVTFAVSLIIAVGTFSAPHLPGLMKNYIRDVTYVVGRLLHDLWQDPDNTIIIRCLEQIFSIISYVDIDNKEPSLALAGIVPSIPLEYVDSIVRQTVADTRIVDENMKTALIRMINWLTWPTGKNVDVWIMAFFRGLAREHKYTILMEITESKVEEVYLKLHFPTVREAAFEVLSHMLLSYQHSPEPFHKIVQMVPETVGILRSEASETSVALVHRFSRLVHCLMSHHLGFPDLYEPLLEALKGLVRPTQEEVTLELEKHSWKTAQKAPTIAAYVSLAQKSDTGKTGLVNLGNTCYMNAVTQALFMCDSFRQEILQTLPTKEQPLLVKLQHVMAFLSATKRAAYAPSAFLEASRPPWFTAGFQQDCSEYLRHLYDQLHEQEISVQRSATAVCSQEECPMEDFSDTQRDEKLPLIYDQIHEQKVSARHTAVCAQGETPMEDFSNTGINDEKVPLLYGQLNEHAISAQHTASAVCAQGRTRMDEKRQPTLIERTFSGRMVTTLTCLTCRHESTHNEMFTDLHLAFPENINGIKSSASTRSTRSVNQKTTQKAAQSKSEEPKEVVVMLEDLLQHYLKSEKLEGENKYYCEKCKGLQDGERIIRLTQAPHYLNLTLLRFSYNVKARSRSKIFTEVTYPKTLRLPVLNGVPISGAYTGTRGKVKKSKSDIMSLHDHFETYALCAVIVHSGYSSDSGHYYCYARHSLPVTSKPVCTKSRHKVQKDNDFLQDKWYMFNDSRVSYSTYESFSNVTKKFGKDTAYVLFYKRIDPDSMEVGIVDPDDSINTALVDPPLRSDLKGAVDKDNRLFVQEQELQARSRHIGNSAAQNMSQYYNNWKDHDDNGPPGSCGSGGGGGLSTNRLVF